MAHGRATRAIEIKSGQIFINFDAASWAIRFHPDGFSKYSEWGLYCTEKDQYTCRHIVLGLLVAILVDIHVATEVRRLLLCPLCFSFLMGDSGLSNDNLVLDFAPFVPYVVFQNSTTISMCSG